MKIEPRTGWFSEERDSSPELGIIRNEKGRITVTPWPEFPATIWPEAYKQLACSISRQIRLESQSREGLNQTQKEMNLQALGERRFNLMGNPLLDPLASTIRSRLMLEHRDKLEICDIGGGNGELLAMVQSRLDTHETPRDSLRLTMTTLTDYMEERELIKLGIDEIIKMAIELPPDSLAKRFDIITAQNSIYFLSWFPELVTLNLLKMLRDREGIVLATVPINDTPAWGGLFSTLRYLANCPYFDLKSLFYCSTEAMAVKLTPKI